MDDHRDMLQALHGALGDYGSQHKAFENNPPHKYAKMLEQAFEEYFDRERRFRPGDFVTPKSKTLSGMYKFPPLGYPAVVIETRPLSDDWISNSSQSMCTKRDMQIAVVDSDGDFIIHSVDSRRFRFWNEESTEK